MSDIAIHCKYDELVSVKNLKPHPKNRNKHPQDQVDRLEKIIKYQGVRAPVVVSKSSGFIVKGHGTLLAEQQAGMKDIPVVYQEFENEDQEYAFLQSDNAIATWADLDFSGINMDIQDLGPDFDIDMLGIKDFSIDVSSIAIPELSDAEKSELEQITFTLHKDQATEVKNALDKAIEQGNFDETVNTNKNGNAIARICEWYLNADQA
jgi:hypothetical protein